MKNYGVRLAGWERWLLNVGATLGVLCLVLAGLGLVLGLKPLVVVSGSMGAELPAGSLALAVPTPAAEVVPGQVVSVVASGGGRITHRVVSADPLAGLVLKGDANPVADLQAYAWVPVDRVVFSVPLLGYVASGLGSPVAMVLGGLLCTYLIYLAFFRSEAAGSEGRRADGSGSDGARPGARRRAWLGMGATVAMLAVVIPLGVVNRVEATAAAWSASAAASAAMSAVVAASTAGSAHCANPPSDIATLEFTWTPPTPLPTAYKVEAIETYSTGVVKPGGLTTVVDIAGTSSSYETVIGQGNTGLLGSLLGALLGITTYFTIKISTKYGTEWVGAPVSFTKIKATTPIVLGLIGEYRLTCSPNPG